MTQSIITSKTPGGQVIEFAQWISSLPAGADKDNVLRIDALQGAHWAAGGTETPYPEFAAVWQRYLSECNLAQELVD